MISDKVINSTVVVKAGTRVYVKDGVVYKEDTYTTKIEGATMDDLSTKKSNFPRTIKLEEPDSRAVSTVARTVSTVARTVSTVDRDTATRYGNASKVRMEIRYGDDDTVFEL